MVDHQDIYELSVGGRGGQKTDNNCRAEGKGGGRGGGTQVPMAQRSPADLAKNAVWQGQPMDLRPAGGVGCVEAGGSNITSSANDDDGGHQHSLRQQRQRT